MSQNKGPAMSLQLPKFQAKKNSLELERDNFIRAQMTSLSKAIQSHETPVKEKHIRIVIIGTFQERSADTFWKCVVRLSLQENDITCWKFCHVLHKVLREGHNNVLKSSQVQKGRLKEHGKFWGHVRQGYGNLVKLYCDLLVVKLGFHMRNSRYPGNMEIDVGKLIEETPSNDVLFQLTVELLDYLDAICILQEEIFKTMDSSRCNSMTNAGQCRLKPLIPCILDSVALNDHTTKILFYLHAKLNPDLLVGHRDRYEKVFFALRSFYLKTMSLQYFKNLLDIQALPDDPPNFLVQSNSAQYEKRKVTIHDNADNQSDAHSDTFSELIDIQDANGSNSPDIMMDTLLADKDKRMKELEEQLERAALEMKRIQSEAKLRLKQRQAEIIDLEKKIADLKEIIGQKDAKFEEIEKKCQNAEERSARAESIEANAKRMDEKFEKLKATYGKVRNDHIDLLRQKAVVDKEVVELKKVIDCQTEMGPLIERLKTEKSDLEAELCEVTKNKNEMEEKLHQDLNKIKEAMTSLEQSKNLAADELNTLLEEKNRALESAKCSYDNVTAKNMELESQMAEVQANLDAISEKLLCTNESNSKMKKEIDELKADHELRFKEQDLTSLKNYNELLDISLNQSKTIISKTMEYIESPLLTGGTGALDHFILSCENSTSVIKGLQDATSERFETFSALKNIIENLPMFTNHMCNVMIHGSATSQTSTDIQKGDEMLKDCKRLGTSILSLIALIKERNHGNKLNPAYDEISEKLKCLLSSANRLGSALSPQADLAQMLEDELQQMESAIDDAARKMAEILSKSRASHTGVTLEVNEKLIDSCTSLMAAISLLVKKAKVLQAEIVKQGGGSGSTHEFYKRNHQWTEGLISAAKAVGGGAKFLLESADKAVTNPSGGFEFLIASSQDVAASTIQLVVASQVRAERSSQNLYKLKEASVAVKTATANVVATAKDCAQLIEESDEMDLSKMSTHNAKRLELEIQAESLRLQSELEKTRLKLANIRQRNYHNDN